MDNPVERIYILRVENNGSSPTLKTLFDIVEKGHGESPQLNSVENPNNLIHLVYAVVFQLLL